MEKTTENNNSKISENNNSKISENNNSKIRENNNSKISENSNSKISKRQSLALNFIQANSQEATKTERLFHTLQYLIQQYSVFECNNCMPTKVQIEG